MVCPSTVALVARINLADFGSAGPRNEGGDAQIVGTDAVQSGQGAAEDVIPTLIGLGTFQRPQIRDFFDDAQQAAVAPRVLADRTGFDGIDIAAIGADRDVRGGRMQRVGEWREQAVLVADEMENGPPG